MLINIKLLLLLFCAIVAIQFSFVLSTQAANNNHLDASANITIESYKNIPSLSKAQLAYGQKIIKNLDYNSSRLFRQFCYLPEITFLTSKKILAVLVKHKLSYEQVLLFEIWIKLANANINLALEALPIIKSLKYETGKTFGQYCLLPEISAEYALHIIPLIKRLDYPGNRATQAFFTIKGVSAAAALDGLGVMVQLTPSQANTVEAFAKIKQMDSQTLLDALPIIRQFLPDNAWNARALFLTKGINVSDAWYWLTYYFANPPDIQEQLFYRLNPKKKKRLTKSFYRGGTEIIWKINNYHAITDRYGIEISKNELRGNNIKQLTRSFEKLPAKIKLQYGKQFYASASPKNKIKKINLLRQATAAARTLTAKQLVSPNIYALLAQGSELYDSSFRDILAPILLARIQKTYQGNLLLFLSKTDPENLLIADFIVNLAQKGKLTTFFPENPQEQKKILRLVIQSAFRDEDSIILFSATFNQLLKLLEPEPRNFLIEQMILKSKTKNVIFSKLIRVILQYYLEEFPELLSKDEHRKIIDLLKNYKKINLDVYLKTPFQEWKADNNLRSISIFHPDDDGYNSFISFAKILLKSNYSPYFSQRYSPSELNENKKLALMDLISKVKMAPDKYLSDLFYSLQESHFNVTFSKKINNINISHALFIYSNESIQAKMLELFILKGDEMFAQRGHSYWRAEQLLEPLAKLLETKSISPENLLGKQRFLSLGSCGGVKVYTRLSNLFMGKVDLLATIGTGMAMINDSYNKNLFEIIAGKQFLMSWKDIGQFSSPIFGKGHGKDYIQPGSLPAILHKIIDL